jgi:hypothetical protein
MPRTLDEGFRDFLTRLTPTGTESDAATRHRASIKACLESNFGLKRFVRIGSYGNGTSISGYSDVDYLACLPTDQLTKNSTYSLRKISNALDVRFPNTGVGVRCPAIFVPFGTVATATTEVVPADYVGEEDGFKVYEIADCADEWKKASPDAHNTYVQYVDEKHGGKVKKLIRFVKAWKYFKDVPISSFYLELRVAKYASEEKAIIYDIDIKNIFKQLFECKLARMQDPMGVSGYISACSTEAKRLEAMSKLETAYVRSEKARDAARAEKIKEAFDWWNLVYDSQFPSYYK